MVVEPIAARPESLGVLPRPKAGRRSGACASSPTRAALARARAQALVADPAEALSPAARPAILARMTVFPRARDPDVFPPSVAQFSVTIPAGAAPPGVDGVHLPKALERAVPKRRAQFLAGRICAGGAIARLAPGFAGAVARDPDGLPLWPAGLVGSISHTDGFATAAVARAGDAFGLGVDVERVMSRETATEIASMIASASERRLVSDLLRLDAREALTLVFSAKESLFKALFPSMRKHFDHLDCGVSRLDPEARRFVLRFRPPFDAAFGAAEFDGRFELADGEVRTGVLVSPTPQ